MITAPSVRNDEARFVSTAEIGGKLGISQMHVSRMLTQSLTYLRECLLGPEKQLSTVGGS